MCSLIFLSATSCTWEQLTPQFDCSVSPVQLELIDSNDSECGVSDGSFTVQASGGEPPYTFSSESATNSEGVFENVPAGNYTVLVTDANDCSEELNVEIQNANGVNLNKIETLIAGCQSNDGGIEVIATGGVEPYLYTLNGGSEQASNVFSALSSGSHTIGITDQEGCSITGNVQVLSGVSYSSSIEKIIKNNCTSCHGVSASPSFDSYDEIRAHAASIKRVTGNKSMPRGATISQDEIDRIACWVDDGALSN